LPFFLVDDRIAYTKKEENAMINLKLLPNKKNTAGCWHGIANLEDWQKAYPPKSPDLHWKDGRSTKELARLITKNIPYLPGEIEDQIKDLSQAKEFEGCGEYVTEFQSFDLGSGEGRNHDFLMYSDDLVVSIEAKADETFDKYIGELTNVTPNQNKRYNGLIQMLFGESSTDNYRELRYQLINGACGVVLEAEQRNLSAALFLIIVFKKPGCFKTENIERNKRDLALFLEKMQCDRNGLAKKKFGRNKNIDLYIRKIEVDLK
jgi:hypothetical protein